jgi:transmembrane sensor
MHEKQRLLHKFSERQCSPEELRQLFKYLEEDPEFGYEKVMDEVWQELQTYPSLEPSVSEAMYKEIQTRIQSDPPSLSPSGLSCTKGQQVFLFSYGRAAAKTAAAFAGILLSAWLLYLFVLRADQIKHETTFGTTATIELPDHSVVTINGNSRIHYRKKWEDSQVREVWLEGEAFFSVAHTADHQKFVVHTNNMEIEVLGTEFNVNNRRGETKVTLSSGAVRLNGKGKATKVKDVMMHPGEQASLNNHQEFHLKRIDTRPYTTWKDNVMIFDHTAVREIAVMIEETYGLEVVLQGDSIQYLELSGSLPANDIHALLGMLRETLELDVIRKDDRVIISKK